MTSPTTSMPLRHIKRGDLRHYVSRQLEQIFPLPDAPATLLAESLESPVDRALSRLERCFAGIRRRKFQGAGGPVFNLLHPDHYAMFLYLLANSTQDADTAFRIYYLNKVLHGVDVFPDVALPEVFQFMHATGTVIGHARFAGHFCIYQNCTVGSNESGDYPEFGDGVVMYTGARVIGRCRIGSNVVVGANALVIDRDIPDDTIAISESVRVRLAPNKVPVLERRFT